MPELPEVETTRRGLTPVLVGRTIARVEVRVPALRFALPVNLGARLTGRRIEAIDRRAKYLLFRLDGDEVLLVHLGMSGRFRVNPDDPVDPHDHILLWTDAGTAVRFNDPRRFGFWDLASAAALADHPQLRGLGPEPLSDEFTGDVLAERINGRTAPIKNALLDQRTIAGLGNIYTCEALYRAGISPLRKAASVRGPRAARLVAAIKRVLSEGIDAGGTSLRNFRHIDGRLGYFQTSFAVYDREGRPCPRCAVAHKNDCRVRRLVQGGRSTFYCPRVQR